MVFPYLSLMDGEGLNRFGFSLPILNGWRRIRTVLVFPYLSLMDGEGFEPSKALPTDLQSAPFGHSGIHP